MNYEIFQYITASIIGIMIIYFAIKFTKIEPIKKEKGEQYKGIK